MTRLKDLYRMRSPMGGLYIESSDGTLPLQWTELTLAGAAIRAHDSLDHPCADLAFDLAVMLLKLTSKKATAFFELTGEPRSINVRHNPESLRDTFRRYTKMFNKQEHKEKNKNKRIITLNFERLTELFTVTYGPVRSKLGWGNLLPTDYHYVITSDVLAATADESCKDFLSQIATRHRYIFPDLLEKLLSKLATDFPADLKSVKRAIKATRSRNHLTSLSLAEIRGETMVCIANHHKQRLRLEDWKFLALLDDPGSTKMIAQLERTDYREKPSPFIFCDRTVGNVHAVFKPMRSTIHVVCKREEDKVPDEIAEFIIDPDVALCMYMLLARLKQDKEEFTRLWEEANMTAAYDPFKDQLNSKEDLL